MIRSQILKFNGLDDNCLDEKDAEQCLEDLLKESEETYGHSRNHKQHSNKLLNRYYYKYDPGQLTQKESIDKKSFKQEAAVEDNDFKQMLQNYDPSSSSTGDININIDLKKGLQKNISQLKARKTKLVKLHDEGLECAATLFQMDKNVYAKITEEIHTKLDTLKEFTDKRLRHEIAHLNLADLEQEGDLAQHVKDSGDLLTEGNHHAAVMASFLKHWKHVAGL